MKNDTFNKLEKLIEYIEDNKKLNITLENASEYTDLSKYHLHRIFKAITGKSLMEYARNRKLAGSIWELVNTDLKIIDIAAEYGFNYEQSYIRSFRNTFKLSPAKFRKEKTGIRITEKLNLGMTTSLENGIFLEPKIIYCPGLLTVGIKHKINFDDNLHFHIANQAGNDFFFNHRHRIKHAKNPDTYLALLMLVPNENYKNYIPSIEVNSLEEIPEGMTGISVPPNQYVAFKYIGLHHPTHTTQQTLQGTYDMSYKWIANSSYEVADGFRFERIDNSISRSDYCEIEIFVPIKEKRCT